MSTEKPPSIAPARPASPRPVDEPVTGPATAVGDRPGERPAERPRPIGADGAAARESAPRVQGEAVRPVAAADAGPRRVRLSVSRVDPWSVMKLSFLLSVAVGIMLVVAAAVIWQTLNQMAVFTQVNDVIATLSGSTTFFDVLDYASFSRVISLATMIAVIDIVLLTALSTIMAFLYNLVAALVGGLHLTLTDD